VVGRDAEVEQLPARREAGSPRSVDGPEDGGGVAMGESELAQLVEPLSNIANRKGLRLAA
jgi:hypothetical protein